MGKNLRDAALRQRYDVTVVCVKPPGGRFSYATPETVVHEGDVIVFAAEIDKARTFAAIE